MPTDRLLTTVLQAYQSSPNVAQTDRILSNTTSLLTTLSNPLNINLLTSNLLTAPAIWAQVDDLQVCFRIISLFNTAAITVRKHHIERPQKPYDAYQPRLGGGLSPDDWVRAVVKGADERSSRWQHMLVIAGVLLGMEGQGRRGLSHGLRVTIERALVTAANLALQDPTSDGVIEGGSIVLAITHTFQLVSESSRSGLDYGKLVMVMLRMLSSSEGYQNGQFLELINQDVRPVAGTKFDWSAKSASFLHLQKMSSKPLVSAMGPLSRVIAQCIENMVDSMRVIEIRERLLAFAGHILASWQRNKLSELDPSEETTYLTPETLSITFPALWQVLKTTMLTIIAILRAVTARTLIDPLISSPHHAPSTATHSLFTLRNIHFISSRYGSATFSAYTFVFLTSIDILTRFPIESRTFLRLIHPSQPGQIPSHPLHRNLDLFYLNACEHFPFTLSPSDCEELIITPCSPYLNPIANPHLLEIFEAAHSAMLATLASPHNAELTARVLPFYVDALFRSFPTNLSPTQFRYAFKALIRVTTPPSEVASTMPELAETLLEMLRYRALNSSQGPLPPSLSTKTAQQPVPQLGQIPQLHLSEQSVLLLTLLDALPHLPLRTLEEWLPLAADLLNAIRDPGMADVCKARLWEVLEGGEMDIERGAVGVRWWTSRGGRERVLFGHGGREWEEVVMSGALGAKEGGARL